MCLRIAVTFFCLFWVPCSPYVFRAKAKSGIFISFIFIRSAFPYPYLVLSHLSFSTYPHQFSYLRSFRFGEQRSFVLPTAMFLISSLHVMCAYIRTHCVPVFLFGYFPWFVHAPENHLFWHTGSSPCLANSNAFWTCMVLVAWSPCSGTSWRNLVWWSVSGWKQFACGRIRELNGKR